MTQNRLHVATRKGLMIYERAPTGWTHLRTAFAGSPVSLSLASDDGRTVFAALNLGHFGTKLHRSDDGGATWTELAPPAFPKVESADATEKPPAVVGIWSLAWAGPGQLWCGTAPGGLFHSADNGATWVLNESLWNHPSRKRWMGGGTVDPALHSIVVDPRDPNRVAVAVSCGGVWRTADGGKSWAVGAQGMIARFMPPDLQNDPEIQDPHMVVQCPASPDVYWCQHHNGIFRSTDGLNSWHEITTAPVSNFGFAVAVHPHDPNTAWFVPAHSDQDRIPVDGKVVVTRTTDGGKTFSAFREGLPQDNAFDLIYRHGLAIDRTGTRLAMGSTTGSLWVSENSGEGWHLLSAHLPPVYAVQFAA
jgi:photosystem II stability/assembly factor-like uncharacterized protein